MNRRHCLALLLGVPIASVLPIPEPLKTWHWQHGPSIRTPLPDVKWSTLAEFGGRHQWDASPLDDVVWFKPTE